MQQLAAQRGSEPVDRVLRAAVGGLQGDAALAEGGADLDDSAGAAGAHPGQRGHRPVHESQVADLSDAAELVRGDLPERGEHRRERTVDPDVDPPEFLLHLVGGRLHLRAVRDVGLDRQGRAAGRFDVASGAFQPGPAAGDEPDVRVPFPEHARGGPPNPAARSGDDDRLRHACLILPLA